MRIIQSLWSAGHSTLLDFNAGWFSPEYHVMSWALSCHQLNCFYENTTLYADSVSARLLIDSLQLPYSNVVSTLDELNHYDAGLWALPKIYAYKQQETPFLHVDGDVFIWKAFDPNLLKGEMIAQNKEAATNYYENIMMSLESSLTYFPPEITDSRKEENLIYAYNAGIFGGTNIPFFKEYTSKAFAFVNNNISNLDKINVTNFNIFFEQYLFYCLVKKHNSKVSLLYDEVFDDFGYKGFGNFIDVPHDRQYIHLLGTFKRNPTVCDQMAARLRQDYPSTYYRIVQLFHDNKQPLKKDYYVFIAKNETELVERFIFLKGNNVVPKLGVCTKKSAFSSRRSDMVREFFAHFNAGDVAALVGETMIKDLLALEDNIRAILLGKFSQFNDDFLYQRDILCYNQPEYVFADLNTIYDKQLTTLNEFEIISSQYDWTLLDDRENPVPETIKKVKESYQETAYIIVVPECHADGYSLVYADELDVYIFELLKKPLSIRQLFEKLAEEFDTDELETAFEEFKLLIFGRIKMALQNKLIKPCFK